MPIETPRQKSNVRVKVVSSNPKPMTTASPIPSRTVTTGRVESTSREPMPEASKRLMWSLVAVGSVITLVGWVFLVRVDLSSKSADGFWSKVRTAFTPFSPQTKKPSPAEEEIRALDRQVFPELSN